MEDNYRLSLTLELWLLCALDQTAPSLPLCQQEARLTQPAGTDADMTSQHEGQHPQGSRRAGPWSRHGLRTLPFSSQAESGILASWSCCCEKVTGHPGVQARMVPLAPECAYSFCWNAPSFRGSQGMVGRDLEMV